MMIPIHELIKAWKDFEPFDRWLMVGLVITYLAFAGSLIVYNLSFDWGY